MSSKLCIGGIVEPGSTVINKTGSWRSFKPIYQQEKCIKCGICELSCPESCIIKTEDGYYEIDYDYCKGCGICSNECPRETIEMVLEEK